jgi:hypothetical protein
MAHLGVWAPHIAMAILVAVVRGFVNVIFVSVRHMDIIIEERGLGYALGGTRFWIFLDGIIQIEKFSSDTWTIAHHNGTVISIPVDAVEQRYIDHMQKMAEWGKTPEGIAAVIERGKSLAGLAEVEARGRRGK